ncbi:MAG TPA: cellulase (glycosyl hydrolase family 5) [Ruminiclostridium sp.]
MKKGNFRSTMAIVLTILLSLVITTTTTSTVSAATNRISVSGTQFSVDGNRIWMNGANTPWHAWDDFGGSYDVAWWTTHFQQLHDNGVNETRVWITCDGEVGVNIATDGTVSGCTSAFWSNLDSLFSIAQSKGIYIMATLISFDHFTNYHPNYQSWRNMVTNSSKIDTYVNNYLVPFVNRYKNNPYLWSIDLCNEPDQAYEQASGGNIGWNYLQNYFAKCAVAIHANSNILVTVGIAMAKYNSNTYGTNEVSDAALQAQVNDSKARLDLYSTHYYDWMGQYWGVPSYEGPTGYGLDSSKPALIGECPGNGTTGHTLTQDYENAYLTGWQGVQAWSSNGVDSIGNFNTLIPATNAFKTNHNSLVFPTGN